MSWFANLNPTTKAALIGAVVAVIGILIKDVIVAFLLERRKSEKELRAVFQKYADPLSAAATSLLWRLHEVFSTEGRGAYLRADAPPNSYNRYKQLSTLYRVACLIAWIRAFRRELSYLRVREKEHFQSLQAALNEFESALADGPQMEVERLERLIRLWGLPNFSKPEEAALAVELDQEIHRQFHLEQVNSEEASAEVQTRISMAIAATLVKGLRAKPLPSNVFNETKSRAFEILMIKETWFYRDWQAALGDQMIVRTKGSARQFDVVGFGVFESMWLSNEPEQKRLLLRLNEILQDLNVSFTDDCRVRQLRTVYKATANLVQVLGNIPGNRDTISGATLQTAKSVTGSSA